MSNYMFQRKLNAINYPDSDSFDINDENKFRKLICWLEDLKIRHYKIEDRTGLRDLNVPEWSKAYIQYLEDISCPYEHTNHILVAEWCLSFSLRLEFEDDLEYYQNLMREKYIKENNYEKKKNPLDELDLNSNEFKTKINSLANFLKIPNHPDILITLKAILIFLEKRLITNQDKNFHPKSNSILNLNEISLGFDVENTELKNSLKLLRLLYINNLRDLQTRINQVLVKIQSITANPKTDTALGRVGR